MNRMLSVSAFVFLLAAVAACIDDSVTGTRPLTFSMTASPTTVAVNEDVTFVYEATGTRLQAVWFEFGDGIADTIFLGNQILEAQGSATHAFMATGSYVVTGNAWGVAGVESEQVTIQVN